MTVAVGDSWKKTGREWELKGSLVRGLSRQNSQQQEGASKGRELGTGPTRWGRGWDDLRAISKPT